MSLFAELRRRNVYRAAVFYAAASWLLVQVATQVFPLFHIAEWVVRWIVVAVIVGFPFALLFSWFYEWTPEGLKRESEVAEDESITHATGKKLDRLIIAVLGLAVVLLLTNTFVLHKDAGPVAASPMATAIPGKSIAVLAFADLSPAHDQEYFSDGIAEEILDALAQVQDLKVAGRTSSFYFKGKNETLHNIGEALGVANVLEGSVRKQGDKVRITAQLIRTDNGFHLWSESYDGDLSDVFKLQERIARAIADRLKVVLEGDEKTRLAQPTTRNVEAYQQYLRGRYFWYRRGYDNLQNAVTAFKTALAADPEYAEAWAALAQTYAVLSEWSVSDPASSGRVETMTLTLDAADHALRLDPDSSSALQARAYVRVMRQFDWAGAETDYRAAITRNPRDPTAHQWYGEFLMYQRRWPEAAVQYDTALAIDPLTPIIHLSRGLFFWYQGKPAAALPDFDEALRLEPDFHVLTFEKVKALVELGRFDEAMAAARDLPVGERGAALSFIAAMQDPLQKDAAVQEIMAHSPGGLIGKPSLLAMLGRNELALDELERLFRDHDPYCVFLNVIPAFDPLRQDPRFQALLRQIKLPQPTNGKQAQNP